MGFLKKLFGQETDAVDYYDEGIELLNAGKYHEALVSFRLALRDSPSDAAVLQQIAAIRGAVNGLMAAVIEGHLTDHVVKEPEQAQRQRDLDAVLQVIKSYLK